MTRISFYILGSTLSAPLSAEQTSEQLESRLEFVCRLTEKAMRAGNNIFIAVNDETQAEQLDQLLWSFRPESFIPHSVSHKSTANDSAETPQSSCQVSISHLTDYGEHHDLIINLRQAVPEHFSQFQRLAEVVCQQQVTLNETREHFTFYKKRGYPTETHTIN
jgi:DNA polymerase-3 subunit chi